MWTKLVASNGAFKDYFGLSVAIDRETIVVGAYSKDFNSTVRNSGSVYVFAAESSSSSLGGNVATTWTEQAILMASNEAAES